MKQNIKQTKSSEEDLLRIKIKILWIVLVLLLFCFFCLFISVILFRYETYINLLNLKLEVSESLRQLQYAIPKTLGP